MLIKLPGRFVISLNFWKNRFNVIEEHIVAEGGVCEELVAILKKKYKDDPTVRVLSQYMIRLNRDMIVVVKSTA